MLVFLATPCSQLCDNNYKVKPEYMSFFKKLIQSVKDLGVEYFLAVEREQFGKEYISDTESTEIDYETIKKSDFVCIIPGVPASGGVHVEVGWASSIGKKINMFLNKNETYSPMITGLSKITKVNYYYYEQEYSDELIDLICTSIKQRMHEQLIESEES